MSSEKRRIEKPGNIASIRAESLAVVFGDDDADQKYWQARAGYDVGYEDALRWANLRTQDQAERIAELEAAIRDHLDDPAHTDHLAVERSS